MSNNDNDIPSYPSNYPIEHTAYPQEFSNIIKMRKNPPQKLGWRPELPDYRDYKFKAVNPTATLPNSKMLIWVPGDPKTGNAFDQLNLGSCTANAAGSMVMYCRIKQKKLNAFAPSRLFNYYNARALNGWENEDSGAYIRDAIGVTAKYGSLPEDSYPYEIEKFREKPPQWCYDSAYRNRSIIYYRLEQTLEDMKQCLVEDYPFICGFTVYNDFPWHSTDGVVNLPQRSTYVVGGHAIMIIGFDDGGQRFHFINSWGKTWGKLGRGSIPYTYFTNPNLSSDFWTIRLVD